jgi:hypothetical protein
MHSETERGLLTSPRVRGEVGSPSIRVRGRLNKSEFGETPPHPNPLRASFARLDPASGERERVSVAFAAQSIMFGF